MIRLFCLSAFFLVISTGLFSKSNVVVFLTDDQGWGDLSLNGNTNLSTPHIDSLGKDGASFDRFYVCPVCSPTRAEFLTGRHHVRSGVYSTSAGGERMDLDETTIADLFKKAGYATGAFGKWHNGMQYPYHPLGRGFDYFYGFCSGHWGHYYDALMERNGKLEQGKGFCVDDFTTAAMEGSSFYKLPKVLQWFSGNIGFHHVHHLNPMIPNYNLERCHCSDPFFESVPPMDILTSLKSINYRLFDEDANKMIGFRQLKKQLQAMNWPNNQEAA